MKSNVGVFQLDNGYWAFRIVTEINGKTINIKRRKGVDGNRFKTKSQATKARQQRLDSVLYDEKPSDYYLYSNNGISSCLRLWLKHNP